MKRRIPIRLEPRRKWKNVKVTFDNVLFDSIKESVTYQNLKVLASIGKIKDFVWDKKLLRYPIVIDGILITTYVADFRFIEIDEGGKETPVVMDAKGKRTREYIMKKRLMKAVHGIDIREV